ncbi:MAG: hypothetical protein B6U87_01785 [Candidatus Aenigmarchaeota archaeon ex4484_52]|nr:MAG: hypothetical protein B6U87_01785 [Candidatus Aenigmarchaeota archaeon ex4484_52]
MKAVILAGGKGTRLRPLTYAIPKPLFPLNKKPIIERIILHLKEYGIDEFIITIGYLGYQIRNYLGDGSKLGVSIEYEEEKEALGTAGCLYNLKDKLKKEKSFIVIGGDNFTNINMHTFIEFHKAKKAIVTIALIEMSIPVDLGVVKLDETNLIKKYEEKPNFKYLGGTLIFCLSPEVLDYIKKGDDFAKNIFPKLINEEKKIYGFVFEDLWIDIGKLEEYEKAHRFAEKNLS